MQTEYLRSGLFPRSGMHSIPQEKYRFLKPSLNAFIYCIKTYICQEFHNAAFS